MTSVSLVFAGLLVSPLVAPLAPPVVTQVAEFIDLDQELAGFSDLRKSHQAWMLQEFIDRAWHELTASERATLRADWSLTRPKIEAHRAKAEKEPFIDCIDDTRSTAAHLPFFRNLHYVVKEETAPFALFVEVPGRNGEEDALLAKRVVDAYTPFLRPFLAKLDAEIAPLIEPTPPGERASLAERMPSVGYVVWVLRDAASYQRFFREFGGVATPLGLRAHYSPADRWAFTWSPDSNSGPSFLEGAQTLLHELTHAYLDAHLRHGVTAIGLHWLNEGLPEYLSCWARKDEKDKQAFFDAHWSNRVTETLANAEARRLDLHIPFDDWIKIANRKELEEQAVKVACKCLGDEATDEAVAFLQSRFYADAYLFVLWLNESEDGKHREHFQKYLTAELNGKGGFDALEAGVGDVLERHMDNELELFARQLRENRHGSFSDDSRVPDEPSAVSAVAPPRPRFEGVRTIDALPRVALSLLPDRALRWNRFTTAGFRDAAGTLGATSPPAPLATDAVADLELGATVEREVRALLQKLKLGGDSVLFEEKLRGKVVEFDERRVVIEHDGKKSELPRARLAPARLAYLLRAKGGMSDAVSTATAVLDLLGGDSKKAQDAAHKVAGGGTPSLKRFLADGEALMHEIAAASAIERVLQAEPAQLEKTLHDAWTVARSTALGAALRDPLRELVAERLAPTLPLDAALAGVVHGSVKVPAASQSRNPGASAVVEIAWDFDRTEEAVDFVAQPWPAVLHPPQKSAEQELTESQSWKAEAGRLRPAAAGFVVLPVPFGVESTIELEVRLSDTVDQAAFEQSRFFFGVEVDECSDLVLFDGFGNVEVLYRGRHDMKTLHGAAPLSPGATLQARLEIGSVRVVAARGDESMNVTFKLDGSAHLVLCGWGEHCWQVEKLHLRASLPPEVVASLQREQAKHLAAKLVDE